MPILKIYDVKARESFKSNKFTTMVKKNPRTKRMTYFAVAISPKGNKSYRIISKAMYLKYKR